MNILKYEKNLRKPLSNDSASTGIHLKPATEKQEVILSETTVQ
jgi:hypothetical protein